MNISIEETQVFNINKYVVDSLKDLGIPVYFAARKEVKPPLVVFNITGDKMLNSWDDEEATTKYKISLNLFAKDDFMNHKFKILELMEQAGFIRYDIIACEYLEDVELYMQPMSFSFIKENY